MISRRHYLNIVRVADTCFSVAPLRHNSDISDMIRWLDDCNLSHRVERKGWESLKVCRCLPDNCLHYTLELHFETKGAAAMFCLAWGKP